MDPQVIFLPPYTPELYPIETVFGVIKNKMKRMISNERYNFQTLKGKIKIIKVLSKISKETIYRIWIKVIKLVKSFVHRNISSHEQQNYDLKQGVGSYRGLDKEIY